MAITCLVIGCGCRADKDNVSFYSVPAVTSHRFLGVKNELSQKRRELWIAVLKRDDLTESKLKNQRVCGKHFISEKKPIDWVSGVNRFQPNLAQMILHMLINCELHMSNLKDIFIKTYWSSI